MPSLAAPRRRQPPASASAQSAAEGPPSIGLDDGAHNEFDLGAEDSSLELDFQGDPGAGPVALPSDSGISFQAPGSFGDPVADLPSPVGLHGDPVADLPSPVGLRSDPAADLPSPVGLHGDPAADLPSPVGVSPSPVGASSAPNSFALDLPAPVEQARAAFTEDLPVPVDAQLLIPRGQAPSGPDLDLPIPAADLLTPSGGQGLQPSEMGVSPADLNVTPLNLGITPAEQSLTPTPMDVQPKLDIDELAPHDLPTPKRPPAGGSGLDTPGYVSLGPEAAGADAGVAGAIATARPGVAPAAITAGRPAVSRGVLFLGGGLLLLGLVGAGVLYSGILDPEDPELASLRGAQKLRAEGGDDGSSESARQGPVAERSAAVLAQMAAHTPAAYLEARAVATKGGDAVGAAEAALLLHFHYGPNPSLAADASATLQPHVDSEAAFVTRVIGLASLAAHNYEGAEQALVGEDSRTRLYRGWLHLSQGRLDDAQTEADAVLAALPDEVAARHLLLAVQARRDPVAAIATIQAVVERSPQHAGLQGLLAEVGIDSGRLLVARTAIDAIDPAATEDPGVQAWTHVRRARVHQARGDFDGALSAFDRALELVPGGSAVQVERIRALLAAQRFNDASGSISELVREHPQDHEVKLLQAEVAVNSGDGDIALRVLDMLATAMPEDARVMVFKGEVHAMRFEVEEGQAAFAAARKLDPDNVRAVVGEARLLTAAKQLPEALALLEAAATAAAERPADIARLWVVAAELHLSVGDPAAAIGALDRALEAVPYDNDAQMRRGGLRLGEGKLAEGRADLVAVFERTGGYPGLASPLGKLYVAEGDYAALERLVGDRLQGEQTPDDLLNVGVRLRLYQGRIADASALVAIALIRNPSDWEAHMLRAQVLIGEGKPSEALVEVEQARPGRPEPELMLQRGKILEFNGKHLDAKPEYRRAIDLDPKLHEARFLYGRLLAYGGANGRAIAELRKVADASEAESAPWFPEVWLNIGRAQHNLGKYEEAIASLRKATVLNPKLGEAYAEEGRFHEFRNKHAEAIAALKKAISLGTKVDHWYAPALMNLGRAQAKSGKSGAAKKALEEFLEVASPEDTSRTEAERLVLEL